MEKLATLMSDEREQIGSGQVGAQHSFRLLVSSRLVEQRRVADGQDAPGLRLGPRDLVQRRLLSLGCAVVEIERCALIAGVSCECGVR